jgi:hypothetical protein
VTTSSSVSRDASTSFTSFTSLDAAAKRRRRRQKAQMALGVGRPPRVLYGTVAAFDDDYDYDDAKETKRARDDVDDFDDDTNAMVMQRRRRMALMMVASNVATGVLLASDKAKAFTVGGDNLSGTMFPSSNEAFVTDDDVQREEPYTTKDLVVDFVSPILALRLVNIGFNGGMGGSPKWLDYLVVAGVGVVIFVFATDNTALDAALH